MNEAVCFINGSTSIPGRGFRSVHFNPARLLIGGGVLQFIHEGTLLSARSWIQIIDAVASFWLNANAEPPCVRRLVHVKEPHGGLN